MKNLVYKFGPKGVDEVRDPRRVLGGKGANLAEMSRLGMPVPPGFTITTEVCSYYYSNKNLFPDELEIEVNKAIQEIEKVLNSGFGSEKTPLLVSVRSGARVSMPGMMDTVLNLGLNDQTVVALSRNSDNERFAYDSYRRFIQMYGDVVLGIDSHKFEDILDDKKDERGFALV